MTKKVTLPHDVAEAIEQLRLLGRSSYGIITGMEAAEEEANIKGKEFYDILNDRYTHVPTSELMSALVNGYTIEQSPEEKLIATYKAYKERCIGKVDYTGGLTDGCVIGIETTLSILGIQIEGINA